MDFFLISGSCSYPERVPNTRRFPQFGPYSVFSRVAYVCNDGFELQGSTSLMCQPNGQWSGQIPTCIPTGKDFKTLYITRGLDRVRGRAGLSLLKV